MAAIFLISKSITIGVVYLKEKPTFNMHINNIMNELPPHLGQLLPYSIPEETRVRFGEAAMQYGRKTTIPHVGWEGWTSLRLRMPTNIDDKQCYYARLVPSVEWEWRDTPITEDVRREVAKIEHLFHRITRVIILLVNPGVTLKMHRDPVPANDYGSGPYFMAPEVQDKTPNRYHYANRFLSIKTVISTRPGTNGFPVLRLGDQEYSYDTGNSWFALNEIEMIHGARPVDFARGVLWVDGYINLDEYDALEKKPIPITPIEGFTPVLEPYDRPI